MVLVNQIILILLVDNGGNGSEAMMVKRMVVTRVDRNYILVFCGYNGYCYTKSIIDISWLLIFFIPKVDIFYSKNVIM